MERTTFKDESGNTMNNCTVSTVFLIAADNSIIRNRINKGVHNALMDEIKNNVRTKVHISIIRGLLYNP